MNCGFVQTDVKKKPFYAVADPKGVGLSRDEVIFLRKFYFKVNNYEFS
jgi:hypothetical protein